MAELIFVKYNRTRQEKFQIKTQIMEEAGVFCRKDSPVRRGNPHIRSFEENIIF